MTVQTIDKKYQIVLEDINFLKAQDSVFQKINQDAPNIIGNRGDVDMAALVRIVLGQQISNSVAQKLWSKLTNDINPNNPDEILNACEEQLKFYGLSRQKVSYIKGLANAVKNGEIDIQSWIQADNKIVEQQILSLRGFGPWSAQIFMMFHLYHRNIWPAGDLGIQIGLQKYFNLDNRPSAQDAESMKKNFQGRETAASLLLWVIKGDVEFKP